jgi:hypothetical protein
MRWRSLPAVLVFAVLAAPLAAETQQAGKVYRIGYLTGSSVGPSLDAFKQTLREHGYIEGRNLAIERRSAEGPQGRPHVAHPGRAAREPGEQHVSVLCVSCGRSAPPVT